MPKQVTRSTSSWQMVQPNEPTSSLAPPSVAAMTLDVEEGQQRRSPRRHFPEVDAASQGDWQDDRVGWSRMEKLFSSLSYLATALKDDLSLFLVFVGVYFSLLV